MKCFVVFLMTLEVVNSFPLKNDEDSSLKRKVMSEIQQLCFFQMKSLKILFSRLENLYWCLVNDQGYCWCLFINLFYGSKQQAVRTVFVFNSFTLKVGSVLDQKPLLQSLFCTGVDCFLTISVNFCFFKILRPNACRRVLIGKCNF